jgi:hypothetical protein
MREHADGDADNFNLVIATCHNHAIAMCLRQKTINKSFARRLAAREQAARFNWTRGTISKRPTLRRREILACPGRSYLETAFSGYQAVSFAFAPSETVALACGGTSMTKVHARYALARSAQVRRTLLRS